MALRWTLRGMMYFLSGLAGGHDHGLDSRCGAINNKIGCSGPEGFRCQLLGGPDHGYRMAKVVQGLHGIHIHLETALPQEIRQLLITAAAFMSRHVKRHYPIGFMPEQCFMNRCVLLGVFFHASNLTTSRYSYR